MTSLTVANATVYYKTTVSRETGLRRRLLGGLGRRRLSDQSTTLTALDEVSVDILGGSRVALVGANGAGKTTLLRVMAGSLPPRRGYVVTEGDVFSLLGGAGAGLDPNLTGYDNIIMMGVMLGQRPKAMKARMEEIAEFSGLGERLRNLVSTYSTGMNARLRFSVLMTLSPQILIMDEGVATADAVFAAKAAQRLREFHDRAEIVVMSSHGSRITDGVDRVIWLDQGRVLRDGPAAEVAEEYQAWVKQQTQNVEGNATSP